ncbi:hypothetical protein [Methanomethylovorans sp.]|uniref:hypothetical protein n=1 Tax=Methanomethylovorans sp. TaxID=2758717 RepID=UPI00345EB0CB
MCLYEKRLFRFIFLFFIVLSIAFISPVSCGWNQTITDIDVTYEVSSDGKSVHVLRQVAFENKDKDTRFWRGYYSSFNYYVPQNAKNIYAYEKISGDVLSWDQMSGGYHTFNLNKKIWYGDTYVFYIEYDLPCNSNTAVFSIVESGNRTRVILRTPQSYEIDIERKDYHILEHGGITELVFPRGAIWKNPCQVTCVNHTDMQEIKDVAHLNERDVGITVRFWEGEDAWGKRVLHTTMQSLQILENVTGFSYPAHYNVTIVQASAEDTQGYGGYNQGNKGIYLLHTSSDAILIHELAHYWTRECRFSHIWMDEGHADLYTYLVLAQTNPDIAKKRKDRSLEAYERLERKYDISLSTWNTADNFNSTNGEEILFGYSKAFAVIYLVYEDLGSDTMKNGWQRLSEFGRNVDEQYFIQVMEEISGKDIGYIEEYL